MFILVRLGNIWIHDNLGYITVEFHRVFTTKDHVWMDFLRQNSPNLELKHNWNPYNFDQDQSISTQKQ